MPFATSRQGVVTYPAEARHSGASPRVEGRSGRRTGIVLAAIAVLTVLIVLRFLPAIYGLPVIGLLAAWSAQPEERENSLYLRPRNVAVGLLVAAAFTVVALSHRLLRLLIVTFGLEWQSAVVTLLAVVVLTLPLAMAESSTRVAYLPAGRVAVTKRNILLGLTGLVTAATWHATVGQSFVFLAVVVPILPVSVAASRYRRARHGELLERFWRQPLRVGSASHRLQVLNILLLSLLLGLAMLTGVFDILSLFLPPGGYQVFQAAFFVGLVASVGLSFVPLRRVYLGTNVLVAAGSVFLALQLVMIYLPPSEPVVLDSPLTAEWYVSQGGHAELVNYHYVTSAQRDSLDIVQVVDGRSHPSGNTDLDSYYIFGAPLLAPVDGVVTSVIDGHADQQIGSVDRDHEAGNHIVVEISDGQYILLAHIRQGSIQVAVGDRVSAGQVLAEVGNSGGSTEPHIHIQAFNLPSFDLAETDLAELLRVARTYPLVFRDVVLTRNGSASTLIAVDPRRGDLIRPVP
jgi:murein DD-endopeptidase MepM/ murein hydrolase activator NlpD